MLQDFLIPSILMGLGIAVDVAIATVVRFRDAAMTFRTWTAPVAIAHILLPAAGYYLWWILGTAAPALGLPLGLLAFALIFAFLFETFCEWIGVEAPFSLSKFATRALTGAPESPEMAIRHGHWTATMAVLAVSMDALWSGPAKAAQVYSGGWDTPQVLLSFVVAGLVVAVVAEAALILAKLLRRIELADTGTMAAALVLAKFAEIAVLGGFGFLALWNGLSPWIGLGSLFTCIGIAAGVSAVLWLIWWRDLIAEQKAELVGTGLD